MRRLLWILLCLPLLFSASLAEEADVFAWSLQIGGDGLTTPAAMVTVAEGGVIIVGTTDSSSTDFGEGFGGTDGFVLRVDAQGHAQWHRRLGGSADDAFTHVLEMPDGGCLAMGTTLSSDGDARASRGKQDAWLVRLDGTGETLWTKCLGGAQDDELLGMQLTEDGSIFVYGRTKSRNEDLGANFGGWDAWAMLLYAEDGKPVWAERSYRYGMEGDDKIVAAMPVHEGWLLLGEVSETTGTDADGNAVFTGRPFVQLLSVEGKELWENPVILGSTGENRLFSIVDSQVGWLIAGETTSRSSLMPTPRGMQDIWIVNLRQNGTVYWQRSFGGSRDEHLHSLYTVPSGGYLLLAESDSSDGDIFGAHGEADVWLVRISSSGVLEWQQPIGGSEDSSPVGLLLTEDGGFLVAGTTLSQDGDLRRHISVRTGFLSLLSPNGNLLQTVIVSPTEECRLLQLAAEEGIGYVLGSIRSVNVEGPVESLWIGRLVMEGLAEL